jgi:GNAT superfamily N-acetyltransferase
MIIRIVENEKYPKGYFEAKHSSNKCTLRYIDIDLNDDMNKKLSFMVSDVAGLIKDKGFDFIKRIIRIYDIRTEPEYRGNGYAAELLKEFLKDFESSEDTIVLLRAAPLVLDYPTKPTEEEHEDCLIKQAVFLEPKGFRNINTLCGFEHGIPFLYINNPASKKVLEAIIEGEIKGFNVIRRINARNHLENNAGVQDPKNKTDNGDEIKNE